MSSALKFENNTMHESAVAEPLQTSLVDVLLQDVTPHPSKFQREIYSDTVKTGMGNDRLSLLLHACSAVEHGKRKRKGIPRRSAVAVQEPSPQTSKSSDSKSTDSKLVRGDASPSSAHTPESTTEGAGRKKRRLEDVPSFTFGSVDRALTHAPWKLIIWNDDVISREEREHEKEVAALREANKLDGKKFDALGNPIVRVPYAGPPDCVVEMLAEHRNATDLDDVPIRTIRRSNPEDTAKAPNIHWSKGTLEVWQC
jgi:hypothetical protein